MKDDILKFRKLCEVLKKEKNYTGNKIVIESGLTWPTFQKLTKAPIDEIKIQASILAVIQDFIKKHIDDLNYAEPVILDLIKKLSELVPHNIQIIINPK